MRTYTRTRVCLCVPHTCQTELTHLQQARLMLLNKGALHLQPKYINCGAGPKSPIQSYTPAVRDSGQILHSTLTTQAHQV